MAHFSNVLKARAGMLLIVAAGFLLSACGTPSVPNGLPSMQPAQPSATLPEGQVEGETLGIGNTRVAMLLPLSAEGNGGKIAAELRNAARMALDDSGNDALQIVVKDTGGTEAGARAAAESASREGATLVIGPVFAPNVRAASAVLTPNRTPVVAFSSDRTVAGPDTYLNSFLPEGLVRRILNHAASHGLGDVVAIVPNNPAGELAENEARATLRQTGGNLVAVGRYDYENASVQAAVQDIAMAVDEADAIFIPDGGNSPRVIVAALRGLGVDLSGKQLLGTGQWASADLSDPALQGGWFADVGHARMNLYKARYEERFGTEPSVTSALGYDTALLATTLTQNGGAAAFTASRLQNPAGFSGYTGTFRFRPDGTSERGYAVYEIRDGAAELISPAPASFGATG
ncbi:penicillin-binding protein activator [Chelativorans sp. YIM 93263]|uniref:penicillin-binding protein activator n=1 Tax=Chelativorans sp. YIM 93263 TaxID=2906648 RepID=UPI0023782C26|nr:penicillin-binding protein activator [Chelativorans sp. YIM 93263]